MGKRVNWALAYAIAEALIAEADQSTVLEQRYIRCERPFLPQCMHAGLSSYQQVAPLRDTVNEDHAHLLIQL